MESPLNPAGDIRHLYAHIPFCPTKCAYCAFVTHVGSTKMVAPYVDALLGEMSDRATGLGGPLETVYLGGGTPSMLLPSQVSSILNHASQLLGLSSGAEITMEAHPNTVCAGTLQGYRGVGVNRLSMGVESLDRRVLLSLRRDHSPARIAEVVCQAREAGFASLNLDLMYGLPGQTAASWKDTLSQLIAMEPDHLSLYPLSVEPGTIFSLRLSRSQLQLPEDDAVVEMYHLACETLRSAGFEHYEVANWAKPGHRSRHNTAYWEPRPFLAVGVGAHGYLRGRRYVNMRGVSRYVRAAAAKAPITVESEPIGPAEELDEYLMLRLRLLVDGVVLSDVASLFGEQVASAVMHAASSMPDQIDVQDGRIRLREDAVPTANTVWSRFIGLADSDPGMHLAS